jgi:glyoxylase-like metal-dependent hydrolase (beta-lactamase superfamily II)
LIPPFVEPLGDDIFVIDTGFGRPRSVASYLVVGSGRAAYIDTGHNFAVPRLLMALDAVGLSRDAVDWVIPTHVHLDHAGGAGALMQQLPVAQLLVHPRGAPHLIDPGALQAGATAVYGAEEVARCYGDLVPVPAARVTPATDGMTITLGTRKLECTHTPGHARHHICVWDERTRRWFTGDTFGLSYPELTNHNGPLVLLTTPPVQFDPEPFKQSIARLIARDASGACLTHYGPIADLPRLGRQLIEQVDELAALGLKHRDNADRLATLKTGLRQIYQRRVQAHGLADVDGMLALLALDVELNAQGLSVWLDRSEVTRPAHKRAS